MRLIIAGSRKGHYEDVFNVFYNRIIDKNEVDTVICGCCSGIDAAGEQWAKLNKIPVEYFPANWSEHGKSAGPIRNAHMAREGDAILLIWDGKSQGSASMKREMQKLSKPIYEVIIG